MIRGLGLLASRKPAHILVALRRVLRAPASHPVPSHGARLCFYAAE